MTNRINIAKTDKKSNTNLDDLSEDSIQILVMRWARSVEYKNNTLADYLHHSPNGGSRHIAEAAKFKRMGVKRGYPDLILDIPMNGFHGARIELKKAKGGRTSKEQKERLQMLTDEGYYAVVAKGYNEAVKVISDYMGVSNEG